MGSQCLNTTAAKDSPFFFFAGDGLTIRGVLSSDSWIFPFWTGLSSVSDAWLLKNV